MFGRRHFLTAALSIGAAFGVRADVARSQTGRGHPVLVELFTSQGCHSCPPADALLGELAKRDDVIALGFHIDYWDYIGWKDPFADPLYTDRQRTYARALRNRSIYTPQMVIDGTLDLVGSRRGEVTQAIDHRLALNPAERPSVPISLLDTGNGSLTVSLPKASVPETGEVMLAAATASHTTEIKRGENAGRTLSDFNIVRVLAKVGSYDGAAVSWTVERSALPDTTDMVAVWLQAPEHGSVWGAAKLDFNSVS